MDDTTQVKTYFQQDAQHTSRQCNMQAVWCILCKIPHFSLPHWSSSVEFGITGYSNPGRLPHEIAKTPIYPVMCQFPLFVALVKSTNITDRQTDGRTSCS